jgi:hypothetical protein
MTELDTFRSAPAGPDREEAAISLVKEVIERFELPDLRPLLNTVQLQEKKRELNVAVFGRFAFGRFRMHPR